ncbi:sensor histidine kinase [Actinoplanes sp. G11-F43]|uniref:sensor histidine kinase n=1 Tax=Actinoplanes sp. G11-F43 TaxID=3424130 RepID=UPI003D345D99
MMRETQRLSLFWRIFLLNAAVVTVAFAFLMFGPFTVSAPVLMTEAVLLSGVLVVMLIANAGLLRLGLAPLVRVARTMATVDLLRPGHRLAVTGRSGIADLIRSFNTMLDRLEAERATSAARALSAQEAERKRIAQELHDEVGQTLTAVLLELKRVADHAPEPVSGEVRQVQETIRNGLDEIRRIARRLRPGVLEELGLASALKSLAGEFSTAGLTVRRNIDGDLPDLGKDTELVLYRVAQESLTNTARHSGARQVNLCLSHVPGSAAGPPLIELRIRDDGTGVGAAPEGAGITGMRERALLIGAELTVGPAPGRGTEVMLRVSLGGEEPIHE